MVYLLKKEILFEENSVMGEGVKKIDEEKLIFFCKDDCLDKLLFLVGKDESVFDDILLDMDV